MVNLTLQITWNEKKKLFPDKKGGGKRKEARPPSILHNFVLGYNHPFGNVEIDSEHLKNSFFFAFLEKQSISRF